MGEEIEIEAAAAALEFVQDKLVTVVLLVGRKTVYHVVERRQLAEFLMAQLAHGVVMTDLRVSTTLDIEAATAARLGRSLEEHRAFEAARARTVAGNRSDRRMDTRPLYTEPPAARAPAARRWPAGPLPGESGK